MEKTYTFSEVLLSVKAKDLEQATAAFRQANPNVSSKDLAEMVSQGKIDVKVEP